MGVENLVKKGNRPSDHPEEVERGKNEKIGEAPFYPTASHGRIKENLNPLRLLRLCGEYVTVFMKRCT